METRSGGGGLKWQVRCKDHEKSDRNHALVHEKAAGFSPASNAVGPNPFWFKGRSLSYISFSGRTTETTDLPQLSQSFFLSFSPFKNKFQIDFLSIFPSLCAISFPLVIGLCWLSRLFFFNEPSPFARNNCLLALGHPEATETGFFQSPTNKDPGLLAGVTFWWQNK